MRGGPIRPGSMNAIRRELREARKGRKEAAARSVAHLEVVSGQYEIDADGVNVGKADTITVALERGRTFARDSGKVITVRDMQGKPGAVNAWRYDPSRGFVPVKEDLLKAHQREVHNALNAAKVLRDALKEHPGMPPEHVTAIVNAAQAPSYGQTVVEEHLRNARARIAEREERRMERVNLRREAKGQMHLFGTPGDKPGHPFRGNQYKKE